MSDYSNAGASPHDFEFQALAGATNYRQAVLGEFGGLLRGHLLEVGAGIGQLTETLVRLPAVERAMAVEPNLDFCKQHRARFPGHELIEGTVANVPVSNWDAILSVNVLEHIRDDAEELRCYARLLREKGGNLCLLVPARPEIYAPIDREFNHFRRYTHAELRRKLISAGFTVNRLHYFNFAGYFAWWLNFCLLRRRRFDPWKVRFYDRMIFPLIHAFESRICRPPVGQSLLAVAHSSIVSGLTARSGPV